MHCVYSITSRRHSKYSTFISAWVLLSLTQLCVQNRLFYVIMPYRKYSNCTKQHTQIHRLFSRRMCTFHTTNLLFLLICHCKLFSTFSLVSTVVNCTKHISILGGKKEKCLKLPIALLLHSLIFSACISEIPRTKTATYFCILCRCALRLVFNSTRSEICMWITLLFLSYSAFIYARFLQQSLFGIAII